MTDEKFVLNMGDLLRILSRLVSEIFEKASLQSVTEYRLSPTQLNILTLLESSDQYKISDLCRIHNITPPAATKNIDKLESIGFVRRIITSEDRRLVWIRITQPGRKLVKDYRGSYLEKIRHSLDGLLPKQKLALVSGLDSIISRGIRVSPEAELLCLQCQGRFSDTCILQEHFDRCLYVSTSLHGS